MSFVDKCAIFSRFSIFYNQQVLTAQVLDTGRYVCVADNVAGSAEKPFNLNVHRAFQLMLVTHRSSL